MELLVKTTQNAGKSNPCDPSSRQWYDSFLSLVYTNNDCLNYHKEMMRNPREEITLLQCIYDTYAMYTIIKPFKFFGIALSGLSDEFIGWHSC